MFNRSILTLSIALASAATPPVALAESGPDADSASSSAVAANVANSPDVHAQLVAVLTRAIKNGDIVISGSTLSQADPYHYDLPVPQPGLTRAEVRSQLEEAQRVGDISFGDEGQTMAEAYPQRYAAARAQEIREQQARHAAVIAALPEALAAASARVVAQAASSPSAGFATR